MLKFNKEKLKQMLHKFSEIMGPVFDVILIASLIFLILVQILILVSFSIEYNKSNSQSEVTQITVIEPKAEEPEEVQNTSSVADAAIFSYEPQETLEVLKQDIVESAMLLELPEVNTSVKYFTDYRCYGIVETPHYRLQQACYTDEQGFRRFNDDYVVALGSYYSTDIGDRFRVKLDTGIEFTVILGDGKADCDTDVTNRYAPCKDFDGNYAGNLIEFIIDKDVLPKKFYRYGDLNYVEGFEGAVVELEHLGRDESDDWSTY